MTTLRRDGAVGSEMKNIRDLARRMKAVRDQAVAEVGRVVVGMESVTDLFLVAMVGNGHVLLEGVPGVAKTTLSKTFARALGTQYQRIQFTPDLLPADVTGTYVFDRKQDDFVLRKGPVFTQVLLADEINRAPAKTQSALLEAMQENQVTIEGNTLALPRPFLVLATQNPVEQEGVYRLPEAQLDRFLLRVPMGYPGHKQEVNLLRMQAAAPAQVEPLITTDELLEVQWRVNEIHGTDALFEYIVDLAEESRQHPDLALGASPRASLSLLKSARARAMLDGRHYFTHADVMAVAPAVLSHRLIIRPEAEVEGKTTRDVVRELLDTVAVLQE
jgi:MoxR-like ATPase